MDDSDTSSSSDSDPDPLLQDEHEDEDDQSLTEEEQIAGAAAAVERRRLMLLKVISVLQQQVEYPTRTIDKIDDLVGNFLEVIENDVHEMLCDSIAYVDDDEYRGLDSGRDTEAEVEAILRVFPNVLSRRKQIDWKVDTDDENKYVQCFYYPIQLLAFTIREEDSMRMINLKAVSFVPVVARLAIEFGCFNDELRGGLLCQDNHNDYIENDNVLQYLMCIYPTRSGDRDHHEPVDKYLLVIKQLRQIDLLKKEDIQHYALLTKVCQISYEYVFAEKRFRFLAEWDPTGLTQAHAYRFLPLHYVALYSIQGFRVVFEYGIRYYPKKKGICLLFKKDYCKETPFKIACSRYGRDEIMNVIQDTLLDCQRRSEEEEDDNNTGGPYNIADALITAAIDETIHLDCVYFLLRREPDILQKLLSSKQTAAAAATAKLDSSNNSGYDSKQRKRKR